jgi:hypothetical protein
MKREWTDLEFADWTLPPSEAALLANKTGPTRLGFAVLLKFFQYAARFPLSMQEVPFLSRCSATVAAVSATRRCGERLRDPPPSGVIALQPNRCLLPTGLFGST